MRRHLLVIPGPRSTDAVRAKFPGSAISFETCRKEVARLSGRCAACGQGTPDGATRCPSCGSYLGAARRGPAPRPPSPNSAPLSLGPAPWPPPPPTDGPAPPSGLSYATGGPPAVLPEVDEARRRTRTGLLLLTIGFVLGWIPVIKDLGGLLALIGIIYLFVGRWGFTDRHHDLVVAGGVLLVLSFLATIVLAVLLAGAILQAASQLGSTPQTVGAALEGTIQDAAVASLVIALIGGVGQVLMVYALADRTPRILLVVGLVAAFVVGVVIYALELPQLSNAIQSATSGSTIDLGPINAFENQLELLGLLQIVPSLITAAAYYLIWKKVDQEIESTSVSPSYC